MRKLEQANQKGARMINYFHRKEVAKKWNCGTKNEWPVANLINNLRL